MISITILLFAFIPIAFFMRMLSTKHRLNVLFICSLIAYTLIDYKFVILLLVQVIFSFYIGQGIINSMDKKKHLLGIGVFVIVFILLVFKYYNFFADGFSSFIRLMMPVGISYYSFKEISYLVDCYNGKVNSNPRFINYANYITFFPQIICGPITRFSSMDEISSDKSNIADDLFLIMTGIFKKFVIADRLSDYVGIIFGNPDGYPVLALWMAAFFYTVEIYTDFSGYSDIVIGISSIAGFKVNKNFDLPYFSYNIKDFWNRWHISLSSWLRDYIYIPLGGNRRGNIRKKINILITFFVSGLWHGNGLNFIVWGLYHGILDIIPFNKSKKRVYSFLQTILTFLLVMLGWVMFRVDSLYMGIKYIGKMFGQLSLNLLSYQSIVNSIMPFTNDYGCVAYLLTIIIMIAILFVFEYREYADKKINYSLRTVILTVCIVFFAVVGGDSFLYANF